LAVTMENDLKLSGVLKPDDLMALLTEATRDYFGEMFWGADREELGTDELYRAVIEEKELKRVEAEYRTSYQNYEKLPAKKLASAKKELETLKAELLDVYKSLVAKHLIKALEKLKVPVEKRGEYLSILTQPTSISLIRKEQEELMEIGAAVQANKKTIYAL